MSFEIEGTWLEGLFRVSKKHWCTWLWCFSLSWIDQTNQGRKRRLNSLKGATFLYIRRWGDCPRRSCLWLGTPVFTIQTFPANRAGVMLLTQNSTKLGQKSNFFSV